jgi:hypothetical protein
MGKVLISLEQAMEIARNMWEIQGLTIPQIADSLGKSVSAVEKWKVKEGWLKKSEMVGEVRELTRKKFLDQLAEAGLPSERITQLFIEGLTQPMQGEIVEYDEEQKQYVTKHEGRPDFKTRHKYHHDLMIAQGLIGNNQEKGGAGGPGGLSSINIQVNIPQKKEGG